MWTVDRLVKRGWPNCGLCKLYNQVQEMPAQILFQCRFTRIIWSSLKRWLGLHGLIPADWHVMGDVTKWWNEVIPKRGEARKALASLAMLVAWDVWNERNSCVFRNKSTTTTLLVEKIKEEATMWCFAGAKALSDLVPRE